MRLDGAYDKINRWSPRDFCGCRDHVEVSLPYGLAGRTQVGAVPLCIRCVFYRLVESHSQTPSSPLRQIGLHLVEWYGKMKGSISETAYPVRLV